MTKRRQTPSQTVGPFFAFALTAEQYGYELASIGDGASADRETPGQRIRIEGRVFDGEGEVVPDAMIEVWQADEQGRYAHPADPRGSTRPPGLRRRHPPRCPAAPVAPTRERAPGLGPGPPRGVRPRARLRHPRSI